MTKKIDFKSLGEEDRKSKFDELNKELMKLKSQVSRGTQTKNSGKIRVIKKNIARILTITNMKKTGGGD